MTFANMYGGIREPNRDRNENDNYPTPPLATYALHRNVFLPRVIWEPAAGRGWMAWELNRHAYSVTASDKFSYPDPLVEDIGVRDFLSYHATVNDRETGVVTNPPYARNMAQSFIEKGLKHHSFVAMLCRLTFAESMRRNQMFNEFPPSDVLVFSGRFSCEEKSFLSDPLHGMIAYAWWVWDYRRRGPECTTPKLRWIDTKATHADWLGSLSPTQLETMRKAIV